MRCAVCMVRSIGLAYTAEICSFASRCAAASACPTPLSDRSMPGSRPDNNGPVCAVTACRTSTSRVGGFGFCSGSASGSACVSGSDTAAKIPATVPYHLTHMTEIGFSPTGPPETVLTPETDDALEALRAALAQPIGGRRDAVADVCARWPRFLDAWAQLGQLARDDVEAYAYFRVAYHRGLDQLRQSGWRGSGYVRWRYETNRGFLRALEGLRAAAEAIGEIDEAHRGA